LVYLTLEEHNKAHCLRYELYGQEPDRVAFEGLSRTDPDFLGQHARLGHETMKKEGIGFYNSELQKELGSRPKPVTIIRESFYKEKMNSDLVNAFWSENHIFVHQTLNIKVAVQGGTITRSGLLIDVFLAYMSDGPEKTDLIAHKRDFSSAWLKVMKDERKSYKGWSIHS
jgi:hypothetical protein